MSEVDNKVKMIVEGLLLAAGRPLTLDNIIQVFSEDEKPDRKELKTVMDNIAAECDDRGFELIEVASGFRFQVKQDLSEWVAKLWEERPPRYTRALLETLSLIAYRQPITRGDIEEIRGVAVSSNIIRTLLDREWVRVVGHRDVPGRPAMFATTKQFLDYFNLKSLQELPPLSEIKDLEKISRENNLDDDLQNSRVLELPEDAIDESSFESADGSEVELLDVEQAIELSKKPLDEILNIEPEHPDTDDDDLANWDDVDVPADAFTAADNDEATADEPDAEDSDQPDSYTDASDPQGSDAENVAADDTEELEHPEEVFIADDNERLESEQDELESSALEFSIEEDPDDLERG